MSGPRDGPAWAWVPAWAGLAWMAGVAWQLQQPVLGETAGSLAMGSAAACAAALAWILSAVARVRRRQGAATRALAAAGRAALLGLALAAGAWGGFLSTELRAAARLADRLPPALEGRDLVVVGTIASLPRLTTTGTRFALAVESARTPAGESVAGLPSQIWLGWFHGIEPAPGATGGPATAAAPGETPAAPASAAWRLAPPPDHPLRVGDRWELTVRLKRPHGGMNPHGFDLELWMFERGLGASGSVRPPGRLLAEAVSRPVDRLRQRLRDDIAAQIAEPRWAGIVAALAVGDQAAIASADWEIFRLSGVAHLMSISGLHVTMFAWLSAALIGALWRAHPRLMLAVPAPTVARIGGLALAVGYALLAGWGVPAQRTVWMLAVVVALRGAGRQWSAGAILVMAAGVVTVADPWAMLQPGFWLSFVAVGVLIAAEPPMRPRPGRGGFATGAPLEGPAGDAWPSAVGPAADAPASAVSVRRWVQAAVGWLRREVLAMLRTQVLATIGLAPLTLIFFQQLSLVGFVANLVAIPAVTLLITPLSLLGALHAPVWTVAAEGCAALMPLLEALAAWPGGVWAAPAAPPWALVMACLGASIAVLPLPRPMRLMGLPLLLPLLGPPLDRPAVGEFEVVAADVGQGTAVLVRTRHHLLVYDTGPVYTPESDAGQRVLVPVLRGRGERVVHRLVLSHRDADHIGGAESLMASVPVQAVSSSIDPADAAVPAWPPGRDLTLRHLATRLSGATHTRCADGQSWDWDGVRFEMIHPLSWETVPRKSNALSCVLRVAARGGHSLLLTGDIEAAQERALVRARGEGLRSTVLSVPHHGSRTSSTPAFIDAVAPSVAVVQAAYRSPFGHPAPDVVERYESRGALVVRSDRCGAWTWRSPEPSGRCERDIAPRYWHWRPAPE